MNKEAPSAEQNDEQSEDKTPFALRWSELGLPLPRLQLTWEKIEPPEDGYNWLCKYEILIPLPKHDIRNERKWGFYAASIGGTRRGGERPPDSYGKLDTPFRDGAHVRWDALHLGMPAYVVYEDKYRRIDGPSRQWPPLEDE
jgi:hypothetical protein